MAKEEITYSVAVAEIEDILEKIEEGKLDVDELTQNVKRVTSLLKICREKLTLTEKEITEVLDEEKDREKDREKE